MTALEPPPLQNLSSQAQDAISDLNKFLQTDLKTSEDSFNESSEKTKEEIRDSLDSSKQLPLANIFIAGRKEIKEIVTMSGHIIEKCVDETEFAFLKMSSQLAESQLVSVMDD